MKIIWYSVAVSLIGWGTFGAYEGYKSITNVQNDSNLTDVDNINVSISGEVNSPGNYVINKELVLYDLIMKAGGLTNNASTEELNFEEKLQNGKQIFIKPKNEIVNKQSLNKATEEEINAVPNISYAVASNIISYRNTNGSFSNWETLLSIKGIGEKTLEKLQNYFYI